MPLPTASSTITSRQLNQDVSAAKRASRQAPVIITDRGKPAFVLMTYKDYRKLETSNQPDGAELLKKLSLEEDIELEFERLNFEPRPVDF